MKIYQTLLSLLMVASTTILTAQVPGYVPSSGLKAWWSFTGNVNDNSGNGNHFTNNGATLNLDRYSNLNASYSFDGINDYMQLTTPSFAFGEDSAYTMSFWAKYNSSNGGWIFGHGLTQGAGGSGKFCQFFAGTSTGAIQWRTNKQGQPWLIATSSFTVGVWDHWVCVYQNKTMTLYKNGVSVATQSFTYTGTATATMPLKLGTLFNNSGYFSGQIDDFGVWNRALSTSEIQALYNACSVSITQQPNNVVSPQNGNVSFTTKATSPSFTYQWQKDSSGVFKDVVNGGQYAGATTDSLYISNVTMTNNGEQYRCLISDGTICTDSTQAATLQVCGSINQHPANAAVKTNDTTYFFVSHSDTAASFQWQVDIGSGFIKVNNGPKFSGATNDTLKITGASASFDGYNFRCIISNGACMDTSNAGTLTVSNNVGISEAQPASVKIFPNPAKAVLNIERINNADVSSFVIYNAVGQTVLTGEINSNKTQIDISKLNPGYYLFQDSNLQMIKFRIIK